MAYRVESFGEHRGLVFLQSMKVPYLSNIPNRFYESPKLKNWMCELAPFANPGQKFWFVLIKQF